MRLNVLKEAHALFKSVEHFYDLDDFDKKRISGYRLKEAEDWWFFGTVSKGEILSDMIDKRIGKPQNTIQRQIFKDRVALLDSIYYD